MKQVRLCQLQAASKCLSNVKESNENTTIFITFLPQSSGGVEDIMDNKYINCIDNLNNDNINIRFESLNILKEGIDIGKIARPTMGDDVNNHIHTNYSFSPYSPTKAVWMAYNAGLATAGIMDHDSISCAREFIEAGKIIGIETTIGFECRIDCSKTPLNGKTINNPDQKSVAYVAVHGIPHTKIDGVNNFIAPFRDKRNKRNAKMTDNINKIMQVYGIKLDFERDIMPISKYIEGGSITERHILYGLSLKLIEKFGRGLELVSFLKNKLELSLSSKLEDCLLDIHNAFYVYDLLGGLKSDMVPMFYIDAHDECPSATRLIEFCSEIGAISAYAYLGDITDSVTGDKKSKKFEDDYIDLLFDVIKNLGFNAITYMPSRNTMQQLMRIKSMSEIYGFMQISGEDINSPRQSFICSAARNIEFSNLIDSTWALIGHEKAATKDINNGMFSLDTAAKYPNINDRINVYKKIQLKQV